MGECLDSGQLTPVAIYRLEWRRLGPLMIVTAAAAVFTLLLIFVRLRWAPLESADHTAAADLNNVVAGHGPLVSVLKAVTSLGGTAVLCVVVGLVAILLLIRRLWRLALYLLVAGAGALVLDPVLKSLVGRLRPVLAHPIAHGTGNSFPSGHALGSMVCYGAILLVFLPAARGWRRTALRTVVAAIILIVGVSRILLGVHYVSDVVGGWAIGVLWLGLTAFAFELTRASTGQRLTDPVTEGLEPEDRRDLALAKPEGADPVPDRDGRRPGRIAASIVVTWVLILGAIVGIGELITKYGNGNVLGDQTIPRWFAAHRTSAETHWSLIFTTAGGTVGISAAAVVACVVFLAITRRWRPVVYIATLMAGEITAFLAAAAIVKRPRPGVTHLDQHLPTSAYPSGHTAATCCIYGGIAILVIGMSRGWWRWLFVLPAVAMPVLVGLSRIYRGEHHPTDVLGGMLFAALWLTAATFFIRPAAMPRDRSASTQSRAAPSSAQPHIRARTSTRTKPSHRPDSAHAPAELRRYGLPLRIRPASRGAAHGA